MNDFANKSRLGSTPLRLAARQNGSDVAVLLVDWTADPSDSFGYRSSVTHRTNDAEHVFSQLYQ